MEKKKQTLYNFVSLRSPQSVTGKEKDFRFIDVPCYEYEAYEEDLTCKELEELIIRVLGSRDRKSPTDRNAVPAAKMKVT